MTESLVHDFAIPLTPPDILLRRDNDESVVFTHVLITMQLNVPLKCCKFANCAVINHSATVFAIIYRPPKERVLAFLDFLDCVLSYANDMGYKLVIGGDLNIDILNQPAPKTELLGLFQHNGVRNVITSTTRVTPTTPTFLLWT